MTQKERDLILTLKTIIEIVEEEADKILEGKKPNWKKAATQVVEEAYGVISRTK